MIQMNNTASQSVAANAPINLGSAQHRINQCALNGSGSGVNILKSGYYKLVASITFTAPATGVVSVAAQIGGTSIVGATASESVNTADTEVHNITLNKDILIPCGSAPAVLSLENTGIACTVTNVSLSLEKLK